MLPGFFPAEYQSFDHHPGDVFADLEQGKYGLMRVLTVDRVDIAKGEQINIAGQSFTASDDDYLLIVGCALGAPEYQSIEDAKQAPSQGRWLPGTEHAPMRATCVTRAQVFVLNVPVREDELCGYHEWRRQFAAGEAGVF